MPQRPLEEALYSLKRAGMRDGEAYLGSPGHGLAAWPWHEALALAGVVPMLHVKEVAGRWWDRSLPQDDEDEEDFDEHAHFRRWKAQVLRRRHWPALPLEDWALLVRQTLVMAYTKGVVGALVGHRARWPSWRFCRGAGCEAHGHLHGTVASVEHAVWSWAIPPLGLSCDCRLQPLPAGASESLPDRNRLAVPCDLWGIDKRNAAREYVLRWVGNMIRECDEPC